MSTARLAGGFSALWGTDDRDQDGRFRIYAAYLLPEGGVAVLEHAMEGMDESHLSESRGSISMRRCVWNARFTTCLGLQALKPDKRGWLRHGAWPETVFPIAYGMSMEANNTRHAAPSLIRSFRWKAMGCMRLLSAPSTQAPLSLGISASRLLGRKSSARRAPRLYP